MDDILLELDGSERNAERHARECEELCDEGLLVVVLERKVLHNMS